MGCFRAEEWGGEVGQSCYQETQPITTQPGYWGSGSERDMIRVVESTINKLNARGMTVKILNITQLSEYRKDAHPSIYRKQWTPLTQQQIKNPLSYSDCFHWCLPGVPDVWNHLLYAHMFSSKIQMSEQTHWTVESTDLISTSEGDSLFTDNAIRLVGWRGFVFLFIIVKY